MSEVGYKPSEWGQIFHALDQDEVLGAGAAGPGKSWVLLMDPTPQIQVEADRCHEEHPHYHSGHSKGWALHLRRTRPMLEQTIVRSKTIFRRMDPGARFQEQNTTWVFSSGYHYQFGHCKDPGDWEIYMSSEYTWIGFDELVQFEQEQYEQIKLRLRTSDPVLKHMLRLRAVTNPLMRTDGNERIAVRDPYWVRKYFVDPAPTGRTTLKKKVKMRDGRVKWHTRIYLPATLWDNPDPEFVEQYETKLQGAKPHIRKALLYGDWYVTAGSFYGDAWNNTVHVVKPFTIPMHWRRFRSMDWGFKTHGIIGWFAMDEEDNLILTKELLFIGKHDSEIAEEIRDIEEDMGLWRGNKSLLRGPADTQLWEQRGERVKSKAATFQEMGVQWVPADKKPGSRKRSAQLLIKRLSDHGDYRTYPGFCVFNTCTYVIRTLPGIGTSVEDLEAPAKGGDDHGHDMIMYGCSYASSGTVRTDTLPWFDDEPLPQSENESRGNYGYGQH